MGLFNSLDHEGLFSCNAFTEKKLSKCLLNWLEVSKLLFKCGQTQELKRSISLQVLPSELNSASWSRFLQLWENICVCECSHTHMHMFFSKLMNYSTAILSIKHVVYKTFLSKFYRGYNHSECATYFKGVLVRQNLFKFTVFAQSISRMELLLRICLQRCLGGSAG